jgi:hypothetical protein
MKDWPHISSSSCLDGFNATMKPLYWGMLLEERQNLPIIIYRGLVLASVPAQMVVCEKASSALVIQTIMQSAPPSSPRDRNSHFVVTRNNVWRGVIQPAGHTRTAEESRERLFRPTIPRRVWQCAFGDSPAPSPPSNCRFLPKTSVLFDASFSVVDSAGALNFEECCEAQCANNKSVSRVLRFFGR